MSIPIQTLIYDRFAGGDVLRTVAQVDFDPKSVSTKEAAAKGFCEALNRAAISMGYSPTARFCSPEDEYMGQRAWCVTWEDGPYQWAIPVSFLVTGPWGYTEPYYGFDLSFVE